MSVFKDPALTPAYLNKHVVSLTLSTIFVFFFQINNAYNVKTTGQLLMQSYT